MKIEQTAPRQSFALPGHDSGARAEKKDGPFSAELQHSQDAFSRERLNELFKRIEEQGARLTETPTYSELKAYRELVKTFVGEAVAHMYTTQRQSGWDRQGRQKVYTTVKKIDETLESMTEDIRTGQATKLNIVAKQDAIKGMLVDLYM